MAYAVSTKRGVFELRESRSTPKGPRSRTLATFTELDEATIRKALARASGDLDRTQLRRAALRAGATIAPSPVDRAARDLVRRLARGERPSPILRRLLLGELAQETRAYRPPPAGEPGPEAEASDAARSASAWIGASPEERGEALRDLLELADELPVHVRPPEIDFPRLSSERAR